MPKSTSSLLEPGKAGILKGRVCDMSGGRQRLKEKDGRPSDRSSVQISGGASFSNICQSEAAKAVIDVECFIYENESIKGMGRMHNLEARLSGHGHNEVVQREEIGAGHKCSDANEHEGPGVQRAMLWIGKV